MSDVVAARMKEIRTYFQLNQKEFCQRINLSPSRLSDIEAGNTNPSFNTLLAISENYSVSLDWLVAGKGEMLSSIINTSAFNSEQLILEQDESQLIKQYRKLTERQKGRVDQQIDIYVSENKKSSPSIAGNDEEFTSSLA